MKEIFPLIFYIASQYRKKLGLRNFFDFVFLQKTDAEASEEEEEKEETPKPSPDADTVILFTKPSNQGLFTAPVFDLFQHLTNLNYV